MAGGLVHALAIRREALARMDGQLAPNDPQIVNRDAQEARERRELRARMRRLAAEDPETAREMGLGLARNDPWGIGLLGLNHAGATYIAEFDGADYELARRIVTTRREVGAFSSVEDLGITLDVESAGVERLRERAIFLPL